MTATVSLSFRVSNETANKIDALAKATDRPRSWLLEQAVEGYLEMQSWQLARIGEGLDALDRGDHVDHGDVADWLAGWGSDGEGEPPR